MTRKHIDHWAAILDEHRTISKFMEWLESQGIELEFDNSEIKIFDDQKPSHLIDRYLEVDRNGLEKERRQLLEKQQQMNAET